MILKQFPDINMVRGLRNDAVKPANTWRNVVLNIKCRQVSRTGVESPYSLFLNRNGFSHCTVNKQRYQIETDSFLLTQPGQLYDLVIDNPGQTEICNIHINRDFFGQFTRVLTTSSEKLLDDPYDCKNSMPKLLTTLYPKDDRMAELTNRLCAMDVTATDEFELTLGSIIEHLLLAGDEIKRKVAALPYMKAAVKEDISNRLSLAKDYISSNYQSALDLEQICRETGMSKFHFLRLFKTFSGITPYQYLTKVRMEKGRELLRNTDLRLTDISEKVGFEFPNSFIKAFRKTYGSSPMQYRKN
jgi:AraC family transcriptional regulator